MQVTLGDLSAAPNFLILVSGCSHWSSASWVVWSSEVVLRVPEVEVSLTHRLWESQPPPESVRGFAGLQLYLLSAPDEWHYSDEGNRSWWPK